MERVVFTDGSCVGNGSKRAIGGTGVYFGPGNALNQSSRHEGTLVLAGHPSLRVTNQTMELLAAVIALRVVVVSKMSDTLTWVILTDSEYMINCMGTWIKGWEKNGFKNKFGQPVKNISLLKELRQLQLSTRARFEHVPAHRGAPESSSVNDVMRHAGNAAADALARSSSK